ncbi:MAG: NADP-dependent oxidoreductase [Candidatus Micrarchaeota archaeon]|nr:NADP-dependent oxidoreductase [Candidatus Micrarchaeota archaeon]MDE1849671.1 NADP-dependent oxidoreductase [Candidatus Micrarchaeota archaeon]
MIAQKTEPKMKAVVIHEYGDPSVLKLEQARIPDIGPKDILVRVHATSVNPMDWKVRAGYAKDWIKLEMPAILGIDVAGTVEQVGGKVRRFKVGDLIYGKASYSKGGSYAEYVAVNEESAALAPQTIPLDRAAGVPLTATTAYQALFDGAKLKPGETVIITGAAGGVGTFAVQFAKIIGARVIAVTSGANAEMVRSLGADQVIDYTREDVAKKTKNADVAFDTVGRESANKAIHALKKGGRLVAIAGEPDKELAGSHEINVISVNASGGRIKLEEIANLIDTGKLRVIVDRELPLSEMKAAHELSQSGKARGKIIIKVEPD